MKKLLAGARYPAMKIKEKATTVFCNDRGDFYISDGVKVIIAVVLGALLLAALTLLFNGTVIPKITEVINNLFT